MTRCSMHIGVRQAIVHLERAIAAVKSLLWIVLVAVKSLLGMVLVAVKTALFQHHVDTARSLLPP